VCAGTSGQCGDGTLQGGCNEACDDGNVLPDDGCSPTCTLEPCEPTPATGCRAPAATKSLLKAKVKTSDTTKNQLQWNWSKGAATAKGEFGNPLGTETYYLCVYDAGALVSTTRIEAGGLCAGTPCWKESSKGFQFKDKELTPDGAQQLKLMAGEAGKAQAQFKGRGVNLELPSLSGLTGPIDVRLKQASNLVCWGATFDAPFTKQSAEAFVDKSN
jgi:cysteine-rich repeat protein